MLKNIHPFILPSLLYGYKLYKNRKYVESQKPLKWAVEKQPENAYVNFRYGMSLYKTKDWENAYIYIQKAVNLNPKNKSWDVQLQTILKKLNDLPKAHTQADVNTLKEKLLENPKDAKLIWEYSCALLNNKQYWLAKIQLEKFLELKPNSEKAYYQLGILNELLSNHEEAIHFFSQASEFSPLNKNYKYRIGYNYEKIGDIKNAKFYYDLVYSLSNPKDEVVKYGIGIFHARRGFWEDAAKAYSEFEQTHVTPSLSSNFFYKMGVAYDRCYKWSEAANYFQKAIQTSETINAHWCFKCGQAYERAENYQQAARFYQMAVERSHDYHDYWYFRLGYILEKMGDLENSAKYFAESRRRTLPHAIAPKDAIKNKEEEYLSYYTEYYETLPLQDNLIMFESFFGSNISCNPYAILSYMLEHQYNYIYIVVIKEGTLIPNNLKHNENIIFVKRGSDLYLRYLCSAKYLVNNVTFPYYFIRKEGQVYLNTWHGTPMKTLGKDIKSPFQDHANVSRNFLQATHIISPNRHTTDIILDKYDIKPFFNGMLSETGYPRIDLGLNLSSKRKQEIADILGITLNKPIVFYAPTWRGTSQDKSFDVSKLQNDLKFLNSDKYQLIFRGHHLVENILKDIDLNVIVAAKEIDSNELLGLCDILITDYSSIVYDFLSTGKNVISYIYDFTAYNAERGLYFQKHELIGHICTTIKEVKNSILKQIADELKSNISSNEIEKYAAFDDGSATKRTIDFMFYNDRSNLYNYERQPCNIFFEGPFIPNGISRSFINLMSSLKGSSAHSVLLINGADIASDKKRLEEFKNLPDNISVLSRVGRTPMTLEELWVRNKFENIFKFPSEAFKTTLIRIYKREARRLLGESNFLNAIHFEGYSLFWVLLFSQINASKHLIYQHNDKYKEWVGRFPYLEGVFNSYEFFDKTISVSEKTMENNILNLSTRFNIPIDKFAFCNNTINISQIIDSADQPIKMAYEFTQFTGTKFINIGRMSHEKDQIKLIKAFNIVHKKNPNTRLFILGDGPLRHDLELTIKELGMEKIVYLLGQQPNLFPYLKNSDCFVLSSNHEGQPMVLLESLTLGVPIIATDIIGNRSILGNKYGTLVENSENGLINGMNSFLEGALSQGDENFDPYKYQTDALNKFITLTEENNG